MGTCCARNTVLSIKNVFLDDSVIKWAEENKTSKKRKAAASSCQSMNNFVRKMPCTEENDFAGCCSVSKNTFWI